MSYYTMSLDELIESLPNVPDENAYVFLYSLVLEYNRVLDDNGVKNEIYYLFKDITNACKNEDFGLYYGIKAFHKWRVVIKMDASKFTEKDACIVEYLKSTTFYTVFNNILNCRAYGYGATDSENLYRVIKEAFKISVPSDFDLYMLVMIQVYRLRLYVRMYCDKDSYTQYLDETLTLVLNGDTSTLMSRMVNIEYMYSYQSGLSPILNAIKVILSNKHCHLILDNRRDLFK